MEKSALIKLLPGKVLSDIIGPSGNGGLANVSTLQRESQEGLEEAGKE